MSLSLLPTAFSDMDQFFDQLFAYANDRRGTSQNQSESSASALSRRTLSPALEISDKKTEVEIHAELPGIPKENINIHHDARSNTLTISGEHKQEQEQEEGTRRWSERRYGSFSRTISLPANVNAEQIKASMENGMLKVILPKAPESEGVKKIAVA